MVKQISDNELYLLIEYINSVFWRVAKCLSYIEQTRCLKVKGLRFTAQTPYFHRAVCWILRSPVLMTISNISMSSPVTQTMLPHY